MEYAQAEPPRVDRPGRTRALAATSESDDAAELAGIDNAAETDSAQTDAGPHVWVVVDRRRGPDGRELSTPVVAFAELGDGLRFMTDSAHPGLLVRVPLVSGNWVEAAALKSERDQGI